jgi:hypothetical protein
MTLLASAPNWAEMVTAVGGAILAIGVVIAVVSLRELRRDRHLQWIFEIGRRWDDDDLKESRVALREYDADGNELALKIRSWLEAGRRVEPELTAEIERLQRLPDFFEDVALMRRSVGWTLALSGSRSAAQSTWRGSHGSLPS